MERTHLPEWMADSAIPLHSYGQSEVDRPRQSNLGQGQEYWDHVQVCGVSPNRGEQVGQAEDGD